jgi:hypothetical protein
VSKRYAVREDLTSGGPFSFRIARYPYNWGTDGMVRGGTHTQEQIAASQRAVDSARYSAATAWRPSGRERRVQFRRAAQFVTIGQWRATIDIGHSQFRAQFRADQGASRQFHPQIGLVKRGDYPARELR